MIRLRDISKTYGGGPPALGPVNLAIEDRELAVLVGPSGCGKSTMLSLVNRLIEPSAGRIEIDGVDMALCDPVQLRRHIGFVFQDIGLFPHLTVAENIEITPGLLGWRRTDIDSRVLDLLKLVRLDPSHYAGRLPHELSGGEQQRVGIARALAARPKIMLMDEPFGALDPLVRDELGSEYRSIHDQLGITTILVTHDMTEAMLLADRIVVMRSGEIVQNGTPQALLDRPADSFVQSMIDTPRRRANQLAQMFGEAP
ncbi:MAG: ATP-binding cassette domain-containing protein [Alphaproteobacteria bacterium]|nr:ATP-binding cassette domain-containing protein [Alphaproteobacteria bacterium]